MCRQADWWRDSRNETGSLQQFSHRKDEWWHFSLKTNEWVTCKDSVDTGDGTEQAIQYNNSVMSGTIFVTEWSSSYLSQTTCSWTNGLYPYHCQCLHAAQSKDYAGQVDFFSRTVGQHQCVKHFMLWWGAVYVRLDNQLPQHLCMICQQSTPSISSNFQHCFSVNVWCSPINDQLIGLFVLEGCLTAY